MIERAAVSPPVFRRLSPADDSAAVLALLASTAPFSLAAAGVTRGLLAALARGGGSATVAGGVRAVCIVAEAHLRSAAAAAAAGGGGGGGGAGSSTQSDEQSSTLPPPLPPPPPPCRLVGAILTVAVPARVAPAAALAAHGGQGAEPPPPPPPPPPPHKPFHLWYDLLRTPSEEDEVVIIVAVAVERSRRRGGLGTELLYAGVRAHAQASPHTAAALFYAPYGHDSSIEFIETFGFRPFARCSRYYTSLSGEASDALVYASLLSDTQALETYDMDAGAVSAAVAAGAPPLPDVADALALRKRRRGASWATAAGLYVLPFAILLVLSIAVHALLVRAGPLTFLAEHLRPATHGAAAAAAALRDALAPRKAHNQAEL